MKKIKKTLHREFCEEAIHSGLQEHNREAVEKMVEKLFASGGELVYKGYVDDPRNTDNAWMETVAYHLPLVKRRQQIGRSKTQSIPLGKWMSRLDGEKDKR